MIHLRLQALDEILESNLTPSSHDGEGVSRSYRRTPSFDDIEAINRAAL
jgi:hypothetical protein